MDENEISRIIENVLKSLKEQTPITQEQIKQLKQANQAMQNSTKSVMGLGAAAKTVAKGLQSTARSLAQGQRDLDAMNSSIDGLGRATSGILKKKGFEKLSVAVGLASDALQAGVEILTKQLSAYQQMGKLGALGAKGLDQLQNQFTQANLSLGQYVNVVKNNSVMLAKFGGSTFKGAEQFSKAIGKLTLDESLLKLGGDAEGIAQVLADYTKRETLLGRQREIQERGLAEAGKEYYKQLDLLAKISGEEVDVLSRRKVELLQDTQYRARIAQGGTGTQILEDLITSLPPGIAKGIKDYYVTNGAVQTEEGIGIIQAGMDRVIRDIQAGRITNTAGAYAELQKGAGSFTGKFGSVMPYSQEGFLGLGAEMYEMQLRTLATDNELKSTQIDQIRNNSRLTTDAIEAQIKLKEAAVKLDKTIATAMPLIAGISSVTASGVLTAIKIASAAINVADATINVGKSVGEAQSKMYDDAVKNDTPLYQMMADGGPVTGGKEYIVGEQGPELFTTRTPGNIINNEDLKAMLSASGVDATKQDFALRAGRGPLGEAYRRTLNNFASQNKHLMDAYGGNSGVPNPMGTRGDAEYSNFMHWMISQIESGRDAKSIAADASAMGWRANNESDWITSNLSPMVLNAFRNEDGTLDKKALQAYMPAIQGILKSKGEFKRFDNINQFAQSRAFEEYLPQEWSGPHFGQSGSMVNNVPKPDFKGDDAIQRRAYQTHGELQEKDGAYYLAELNNNISQLLDVNKQQLETQQDTKAQLM